MARSRDAFRAGLLLGAALLATGAVVGVVAWDSERESQNVLAILAAAQGTLARALAMGLDSRLDAEEARGGVKEAARVRAVQALLGDSLELRAPRQTLVLVGGPGALEGAPVEIPAALEALVRSGGESAVLGRDDAARLGLPQRRAVAAWRPTRREGLGVLVVASADVERRRAERALAISILSVVAAACLVAFIGVAASRRDAEQVKLRHRLDRERLERDRDEQLRRADRVAVASALSLGIAHELATPLGVISARLEGLQRHLDAAAGPALEIVRAQVDAMRQILQRFLALARGDAPQTRQVSADEIARAAAFSVAHRFDALLIGLELEVGSDASAVWVDEILIRHALVNLLLNAANASSPGQRVTLRVSKRRDMLEFCVSDEGEGIAPHLIDEVLKPFVTTRADGGGTGLGLAITQELARHHGGTVSIQARLESRGTLACLRLPLAVSSS